MTSRTMIKIKLIPYGKRTWLLWTDDFEACEVMPLYWRILNAPIYGIMFFYYCLKGLPIKVEINYGNKEDVAADYNTTFDSSVFADLAQVESGLGTPAGSDTI